MSAHKALQSDVVELARPEGRVPGTKGHTRAREYLLRRMEEMGLLPWSGRDLHLPYRSGSFEGYNLAGVVPGSERELAPVLVGAHYDSVIAAPCADDNAAAVAIALAVAGERKPGERRRDLVLALFDAEEQPYTHTELMGSNRFYADDRDGRDIHCALIQDLTGHDVSLPLPPGGASLPDAAARLANLLFITGAESHGALPGLLGRLVRPDELPVVATLNRNVGDVSDHGVFRRSGVPYLFFSCGHWAHYHQPTDTPEKLNYRKMEKIARLIASVALGLDDLELPPSQTDADTAAFESELLHTSLGPFLAGLLALAGLSEASSRGHLDQFAARLQSAGL